MCQPRTKQRMKDDHGCCCGCGCGTLSRNFVSAKEQQDRLQDYKKQLESEIAGVEEHIKGLQTK